MVQWRYSKAAFKSFLMSDVPQPEWYQYIPEFFRFVLRILRIIIGKGQD